VSVLVLIEKIDQEFMDFCALLSSEERMRNPRVGEEMDVLRRMIDQVRNRTQSREARGGLLGR
jgi:hypothetical protein